jgi:hypothetical protein
MRKGTAVLLAILTLGGCAQHVWVPGPGATASFGQANGQCKLTAMGAEHPVNAYAAGNTRFVATYLGTVSVLGAIDNAVRENNAYNACMEAQGFLAADQMPVQAQAAPVPMPLHPMAEAPTPRPVLADPVPMASNAPMIYSGTMPVLGLPDHLPGETVTKMRRLDD